MIFMKHKMNFQRATRGLRSVVFLALTVLTTLAHASENTAVNEDVAQLQKLLKPMSTVSAQFVQHSFDGKGSILQTLEGELKAKAPGKFRWQTQPPYEQLLVTDGKTLWLYDQDLEQVTVQPLDKRVESTPALMLSGELNQIEAAYEVYAEQLQNEWHFVLIPKASGALFDRLRLEFDAQNKLQRMIIKDEIGQKTVLSFKGVENGIALNDDLFFFVPPKGVDVISQGALANP